MAESSGSERRSDSDRRDAPPSPRLPAAYADDAAAAELLRTLGGQVAAQSQAVSPAPGEASKSLPSSRANDRARQASAAAEASTGSRVDILWLLAKQHAPAWTQMLHEPPARPGQPTVPLPSPSQQPATVEYSVEQHQAGALSAAAAATSQAGGTSAPQPTPGGSSWQAPPLRLPSKPRLEWTPELHARFVAVVEELGVESAIPTAILKRMGVPELTRENVSSHLQKYRQSLQDSGKLHKEWKRNKGGRPPLPRSDSDQSGGSRRPSKKKRRN